MNTSSLSLLGPKRIAGVALFLFLLVAPRCLARPLQQVIVGDNNPIDTGQYCSDFNGVSIGTDKDLRDCYLAQAFSVDSAVDVDQVTLTLIGNSRGATSPLTYPFLLVITSDLSSCSLLNSFPTFPPPGCSGPAVRLLRTESVVVPASTGDQSISLTDSFPTIFLPKGTYYLVLGSPNGVLTNVMASLTWAPNQLGSAEVGTLGGSFCSSPVSFVCPNGINWYLQGLDPTQPDNMFGTNGTFAFNLEGPISVTPVGGSFGQILRILVAGPVTPAPGEPIEAQLGFVDMNGNPIGPSSTVTVGPGQIQSLDLNLSQFVTPFGQRIEVRPVLTQPASVAGAPSAASQLLVTTQILDALTGFETVLAPALQPGSSAPALVPQVLAGGQTMRISVTASDTDPCNANLGFADKDGVALGASEPVSVSPGTGTSLDLNANTLGLTFGRTIEVQPIVTPTAASSPGAAPANSVCQITVEVFDHLTGRTSSSQSTTTALPAVQ